MARAKALYDGHAVAAVAAVSAGRRREAIDLIEVEYEVLPHVIDVEAAMAHDAPVLHAHLFTEGLETRPDKPSNIAQKNELARGDLDAGFAAADVVIEAATPPPRSTRATSSRTPASPASPPTASARCGAPARASSWSAPIAPRSWTWTPRTSG
jgi:CO/xanthine dehydrogenase Mo-binding subunit